MYNNGIYNIYSYDPRILLQFKIICKNVLLRREKIVPTFPRKKRSRINDFNRNLELRDSIKQLLVQ